jgi:hypothetical protein
MSTEELVGSSRGFAGEEMKGRKSLWMLLFWVRGDDGSHLKSMFSLFKSSTQLIMRE